jgi:hypothetical protein
MDPVSSRDGVRLRAARWRRRLLIGGVAAFWTALALVAGNAVGTGAVAPSPVPEATPASSGFFGDDGDDRRSALGPQSALGNGSQAPILRSRGS